MAISKIPTRAFTQQGINFRNLIINGDMSIAQRGTSFSSTGDVYVLDRFKLDYVGSPSVRYTVSQDTDTPTGQSFAKSMKFDVTTAEVSQSETTRLWTRIESQNLQMLKYGTSNAETLSLSFWVKSNLTGTFIFWLYQEDSTRSISKSYTISSANTWEKKTITIDADTSGQINNDNGAGLRVVWFLTADQSTYGSSSLQTSWGSYNATAVATGQTNVGSSTSNEFYITGIQLEVGTSASDFEFLPYDVNLQRCLRYFEICEGGKEFYLAGTSNDKDYVQYSVKKRTSASVTKISSAENCASSVSVDVGSRDASITGRVVANNAFATGDNKYFEAVFSADAEL